MKEYIVAHQRSLQALEVEVNSLMDEGWQPIGGFFINENSWYYQPMVR